jgi:GT2 family glycosyltransferase
MPDEVIVVDQTPLSSRPKGFYDSFPSLPLVVLYFRKPSQSVPRNIGAACSKNDYLLYMDDDVIIPNDLIENHLKVMEREQVDGTSGASSHSSSIPATYPWDRSSMDPIRALTSSPNYKFNGMTIGINGLNFMVKKEQFKAIGGFDPFIPRFTDHEVGIRLFLSGAKIYHTYEPAIQHLRADNGGTRSSLKQNAMEVSGIYLHMKHFPGWSTQQFVLLKLISALIGKESRRRPWKSITRPIRLFKSYREAKRLIAEANSSSIGSTTGWLGVESDKRDFYSESQLSS